MLPDDLLDLINGLLRPLGATPDEGEEFDDPPLDILRLYRRPVRLHWVPVLGRALSVVAVVRQPTDLPGNADGHRRLLRRVAMAVNGRFPPWRRGIGLAIGLTTLVVTPEPIGPGDEGALGSALVGLSRMRAVPLGLFRLNLGQEALAFTLSSGPGGLFPEPLALADALTETFGRFVPPLDLSP